MFAAIWGLRHSWYIEAQRGLSALIVRRRLPLERRPTSNLIRKLLGYHDDGSIEIAADDLRQNRRVDDA